MRISNIIRPQHRCSNYTSRVSQSMFDAVAKNNPAKGIIRIINPECRAYPLNPKAISHINAIEENNPIGEDGVKRNEK